MEIDLEQIHELMRALKEHDVSELELEQNGQRIYLRRGGEPVMATMAPSLAPIASAVPAPVAAAEPTAEAPADDSDYITSPFVGTFYRSPSPDAAPFVSVGDSISPGSVLCIVEAMKLMNEIESEISGEIVEILATNGRPVEYGERLFRIRKN